MSSKRRHEGYLMIDHRASPGVDESLTRNLPFPVPIVKEGQCYESPTITCSHCGAVVILSPTRTRPRHYCPKCDHYVCDKPACVIDCTPWQKVIETIDGIAHHVAGPIILPDQPNRILEEPKLIQVGQENEQCATRLLVDEESKEEV